MRTLVHVTHEAVHKVGGIGAVLEGLLTSKPYIKGDYRTILVGPWFPSGDANASWLGETGEVLYSSFDGTRRHPASDALDRVHRDWHVGIVYGHRTYNSPHNGAKARPEIMLIDVNHMNVGMVNAFKGRLWERFGLNSKKFENSWEYDLYLRLAEPTLAALRALGATDADDQCVILAHEFMGMPTALAGIMDPDHAFGTVFYAHEVSTMRRIVEHHPGHDVTFYNVLEKALKEGRHVEDLFGEQHDYYRHALVDLSRECDRIFAVGDHVERELRFMAPDFAKANIVTTFNGIPYEKSTLKKKQVSKDRLRRYAEALLGDPPDYVFSHVTRTAVSKGLWRDLLVLSQLEQRFRHEGKTAVLFVLSTEVPPRLPGDVRDMEKWWDWPVAHREVGNDLSHGEALFYQGVQGFNARSRNIKVVYINQFGFCPEVCGERMPEDIEFMDIRRGVDVEFGQSIYEPFGIAQLEPLTFGAICLCTRVCGCAGFVAEAAEGKDVRNVLLADYCDLEGDDLSIDALLALDRDGRYQQEQTIAAEIAHELWQRLPKNEAAERALIKTGYELAHKMSWDVVAGEHVLPEIDTICKKLRKIRVA
jgi:hypothetical protein